MKPKDIQAFPIVETKDIDSLNLGMTLRDYFANSAMQAMIANPQVKRPDESNRDFEIFSKRAYRYADAMLEERSCENVK